MYPRGEILFPHRSISTLKCLRDGQWRELVERISNLSETHEDSLAFCLMMIRLCGCLRCNPGSYRASLGCSACGRRIIGMVKDSDDPLTVRFRKAREDLRRYVLTGEVEDEESTYP